MVSTSRSPFLPSLEGLRGYAFLVVFFLHYASAASGTESTRAKCVSCLVYLSHVAVPTFFALSGYLITSTLLATRRERDFLRTFYWRRLLRIVPAYYAALLLAAALVLMAGGRLNPQSLLHLAFLQNFSLSAMGGRAGYQSVSVLHLWSLAVVEQFYLAWPLAVWLLRDRKRLLWLCYAGIGMVTLLRFAWPVSYIDPALAHVSTATRLDVLLMGCALALHLRSGKVHAWLAPAAKIVACGTFGILLLWYPRLWDTDGVLGVKVFYPLINLFGLAVVVSAFHDGRLQRACCLGPARYLGRLSYGLYLYHFILNPWFLTVMLPALRRYLPDAFALLATFGLAFGLTWMLAVASWHCIERPALRLREWAPSLRMFSGRSQDAGVVPQLSDATIVPPLSVESA